MAILSSPVMAPGYGMFPSRFGAYSLDPYLLGTGYEGTPVPVPGVPSPTPAPTPSPGGSGGGAGGGNSGGGSVSPPGGGGGAQGPGQGIGSGSGTGWGGNAGGAQNADRGDRGGGFGGGGSNTQGGAGNAVSSTGGGMFGGSSGGDFIDLGWGAPLLSAAATFAPGYAGLGLGAVQAAMRAYNTKQASDYNSTLGGPGLDFGQWLGGILGLNDYGSLGGNNTVFGSGKGIGVANPLTGEDVGTPVTTGGMYYDGPSIFGWHPFANGGQLSYAESPTGPNELSARRASVGIDTAKFTQPGAVAPPTGPQIVAGLDSPAPKVKAQNDPYAGWSAQDFAQAMSVRNVDPALAAAAARFGIGNGTQSNGAAANNAQSSLNAGGTMSNPGGGMTAPGSAGTGGLNNGFGGGGYAKGGYVGRPRMPGYAAAARADVANRPLAPLDFDSMSPAEINALAAAIEPMPSETDRVPTYAQGGAIPGRPDNIVDNRIIHADEGEFVVRRTAAKAAGRKLLGMLNTPGGARKLRGMLG